MPNVQLDTKFTAFARLGEQDKILIQSLPWQYERTPRHREIVALGGTPNAALMLLKGWAANSSVRRDGSRRITSFVLPGDICWLHAVSQMPMDQAIFALTDCEYATISATTLNEAARSSERINAAIFSAKIIEDAILRKWLRNSSNAESALAHLLLELHARLAAIGPTEGNTFYLPATQAQLGDALSLTAVHLNRMLRILRELRLVKAQGGKVTILDVDELKRRCDFNPSYLHFSTRM